MLKFKKLFLIGLLLSVGTFAAHSGPGEDSPFSRGGFSEDPVTTKAYSSLARAPRGGSFKIALELTMEMHWHINANTVTDPYLIPTTIAITLPEGMTVRELAYPAGVEKKLSFSDEPLLLYQHTVLIGAVIDIDPAFQEGDTVVTALVTYQACDDAHCLAPEERSIDIRITVASPETAPVELHADIFSRLKFGAAAAAPPAPLETYESTESNRLQNLVEKRGMFFLFLIVFLGGLALNLTPCVYPIIPITVSYFGGQSGGKSSRTLLLAILYVFGMAAMYSALGLVAALTGSMLGTALQSPIVLLFVALVLLLLALSMFGFYEIRVPGALSNLAGTAKRGGVGAFFMGLTVGIVAAPCIGPFVLGLLTFVGESGNPLLGFFMFFTLAIGLGLPFIALALLSGSISRLPKSGEWMEWIRKLFGVVLVAMAIYFLEPVLGSTIFYLLLGATFIISGVVLGFVMKTSTRALFFLILRRFVGIAAPLFGLYILFAPGHLIATSETAGIPWEAYGTGAVQDAKQNGTPVVIDFYADWCLPCKELDHKTFNQPDVIEAAEGLVVLKADLTQSTTPDVKKLRDAFGIKGVPTIVFLDKNGAERSDLRVLGFVDKNEFAGRLRKLKSKS